MKFDKQTIAAAAKAGIALNSQMTLEKSAAVLVEPNVKISSVQLSLKGSIGAYSYLRSGGRIAGRTECIGRYCSIAPGVTIGDGDHPTDWLATHPFQWAANGWVTKEERETHRFPASKVKPMVKIGNDVWIGANVIVLSGVEIGDGAIVAAGSVVTRNVEPYTIVAGIPAKIIRPRFSGEIITRLEALKWWLYTPQSLFGVPFDKIEQAVSELERRKKAKTLVPIPQILFKLSTAGLSPVDGMWEKHKYFRRYK
ncbi:MULTISPECIES: CatB-related O-acetyltransferase [unclassified Rhizobium]|uniref:CatB-related O-acetyltransferase n=1 Tax=Rhizobium sp. Leaf386 TaxID=1736359 RepID=UPI000714B7B5|nr:MULTISPECIES: CatB-related O-acetyltransferase [unclassified Rhizobium]KQS96348.1 hypothetical protein ASG50_04615 [Rhizobium sp. Leaf386]KQU09578.1 hypothetical protein ASG68_00760 [Rhizobium sp. Leaf453]